MSDVPESRRGAWSLLAARLAAGDFAGWLLAATLVAAVAWGASWLFTPGKHAQRIPSDDALGTAAVGTIRAARDYEIPDEEATRHLREQAALAERPVYDCDDGAADEAVARIRGAFGLMREGLDAWRERGPGRAARRRHDNPVDIGELRRVFEAHRDAFETRLQTVVREDDFAALGEAHFSEATEEALVGLAIRALSGMVVQDRKLLAGEREHGLVARSVRGGVPHGERVVLDLTPVRDVDQVREEVRERAEALVGFAPPLRAALSHLAGSAVRPTLTVNQVESVRRQKEAAERVKPVVIVVKRGERIIGDGERIEKRHLAIFHGIRAQAGEVDLFGVRLGGAALATLVVVILWQYGRRTIRGFRPTRKDGVLLSSLFLGTLGIAAVGFTVGEALHDRVPSVPPEAFYYLVPFAAGAMIVRSVLSAEMALLFSVAAGAAVGLLAGHSVFFALHAALTSVVAAGLAGSTRDRAGLFRAGAAVGGLGALLVLATHLFTGRGLLDSGPSALAAFLSGAVVLPVTVVGLLPSIELVFGYLTDVKLLELANLNHPALKELIVQAPGTYHHSIIMGSLVEAAAQAIGANALLAKVCAYYHDIGKIRNPLYFAENQRDDNKHEQLAPSMSALIVKRHVTDGVELASHWRLPKPVADCIAEHHGTRLVSYFFAKAQALDDGSPGEETSALDEALFRYAGPKPRTREAALVMIADACEASARAITDPTAERLSTVVQKRINEIFSEGQLDDCELTLRDLNAIAVAIVRALEGIYHTRPEYPNRPIAPDKENAPAVQLVARGRS